MATVHNDNINITIHFINADIGHSNWTIYGLNVVAINVKFGNLTHLPLGTVNRRHLTLHQGTFQTINAVNSKITISSCDMNGKNKGKVTLLNTRSSTILFRNCQFYNFEEGNIRPIISAASSFIRMEHVEVSNNRFRSLITVYDGSRLLVTNSIFMNNAGELFWIDNQSSIVIGNSSVSNCNTFVWPSGKTTTTVKYSTFRNTIIVFATKTNISIILIANNFHNSRLDSLYSSYITIEVHNCSFTTNYGVLFDINYHTIVKVIGTNFTGTSVTGTSGSPAILYPLGKFYVKVNFTGCIFTGNLVILFLWRSLASIEKCQIIHSSSSREMFHVYDSHLYISETKILFHKQLDKPILTVSSSSLTMIGCVYSDNTVHSHFFIKENSTINIYNSIFNNNTATILYGNSAIFNISNSRAQIENTTLKYNSAMGEVILKAYSSTIELGKTAIARNNRLRNGCILEAVSSNIHLTECLFVHNPLPSKGACFIYVRTPETLLNNYFWATKCSIVNNPGTFRFFRLSHILFENSLIIHNATIEVTSVPLTRIANSIFINREFSRVLAVTDLYPTSDVSIAARSLISTTVMTFNSTFIHVNRTLNSREENFVSNARGAVLWTRNQGNMPCWETVYASCKYFLL